MHKSFGKSLDESLSKYEKNTMGSLKCSKMQDMTVKKILSDINNKLKHYKKERSTFLSFTWYFFLLFLVSTIKNKNVKIGAFSVIAAWKQFYGYGNGFINSFIKIQILKQKPEETYPELFF